jgi:hypothetical protein
MKIMCTVSLIPISQGFYLGMNRDELLTRPKGCPPKTVTISGTSALYPGEPEGGTWVGINEHGLCLALINWHAVPQQAIEERVTRGIVIPELLQFRLLEDIRHDLAEMPLRDMPPFRLIAIALGERRLTELCWDGRQLKDYPHPWGPRHWFSSGYDEARVQVERSAVCQRAWRQPDRGPFSICMHRREAATVSYTEIDVGGNCAKMCYVPGPLCKEMAEDATNLPDHYELSTLRLRSARGALLSSRLSPRNGNYVYSPGGNGADEPDIQGS